MNENFTDEESMGKIPFTDKRRFNDRGERINADAEPAAEKPGPSPAELRLQAELTSEIERREAAESKLVGVQAKFEEVKNSLEKETAEMRARLIRTLEEKAKQGQFNFLMALLPVLDNLNRAVAASDGDPTVETLREGVRGTARSFEQALETVGVRPIVAVGETFDPELHEAIDMEETDPENDGKVIEEYQRGYMFGERLLRPARVQVGRGRARSAE